MWPNKDIRLRSHSEKRENSMGRKLDSRRTLTTLKINNSHINDWDYYLHVYMSTQ